MNITDQLVQLFMDGEWDKTPLHRESFPVNMRLYRTSQNYRQIILEIVRYMDEHLHTKFDDYPEPKGIAAPNLGFPLKIIGYKKKPNENQFCLNPTISFYSGGVMSTQTNCGSLRLTEPVTIQRYLTIDFEYYDLEGNLVAVKNVPRTEGGFTIQHEVNQINGITILEEHTAQQKSKK